MFIKITHNFKSKIKISPSILKSFITDHFCTLLNLTFDNKIHNKQPTQKQQKTVVDYNKLEQDIKIETWQQVLNSQDPISSTSNFYTILNKHISNNSTVLSKSSYKNLKIKPWITNGIIKSIRTRDTLKAKVLRDRENLVLLERFKT